MGKARSDPEQPGNPQQTGAPAARVCPDCGSETVGEFCPACGQRFQSRIVPIGQIIAEAVSDTLSVDSKTAATLKALFHRPGGLTAQYLAGRRTRYVPPFRLYVFASVVYLLVLTVTGSYRFLLLGGVSRDASTIAAGPFTDFVQLMPQLMPLLVMPFFGLVLKFLYRDRLLAEHLIFTLHYWAFAFLVFPLDALVAHPRLFAITSGTVWRYLQLAGSLALYAYVIAYLAIALRRVYGGSRLGTAAQSLALWTLVLGLLYILVESAYRIG